MKLRRRTLLCSVPLLVVASACSSTREESAPHVGSLHASLTQGSSDDFADPRCSQLTLDMEAGHSSPLLVARREGVLDLFYNAPNTNVRHRAIFPGQSTWSAEDDFGGATLAKPGAVAWGFLSTKEDRFDIFSPGTNAGIWHRWWTPSATGNWEGLGDYMKSAMAVSSWGVNRLDMFYRGGNDALWHRWYANGWSAADENLGGNINSDPAAVSWGDQRIDIVARNAADSQLWHLVYDHAWKAPELLGGTLTSSPTIASGRPNRLDVFWRGPQNTLKHKAYTASGWQAEEDLGGTISGDPAAASWGPNRIDVMVQTPDASQLVRRQFTIVNEHLVSADCYDQGKGANIVVGIEASDGNGRACSGVLLTPTTVLTSRACVAQASVGAFPTVRVGSSWSTAKRYFSTRKPVVMAGTAQTAPSAAENGQLAIVSLDPRVPVLEDALIPHQQLVAPLSVSDFPDDNGAWTYANVGLAGWSAVGDASASGTRQKLELAQAALISNSDFVDGVPYWVRDSSSGKGKLYSGDQGGPLYVTLPSGERQVIGIAAMLGQTSAAVTSCPQGASCDVWVDITAEPNRSWILQQVQILQTTKNTRWFDSHEKSDKRPDGTSDWWTGEVDYTGPCDASRDADCDHWYDSTGAAPSPYDPRANIRDNCPGWFNPSQVDVDDDTVGDDCDNCPLLGNSAQANTSSMFANMLNGPITPPVGRVAVASEQIFFRYPGDGCRDDFHAEPSIESFVQAVWAPSRNDVWAVGGYGQTAHWDGTTWTRFPALHDRTYYGVWGSGPSDVWAVGQHIAHFDGTSWTLFDSKAPAGHNELRGVWGTGRNDVWAVGYGNLFHWDGSAWTQRANGMSGWQDFRGVSGSSSNDVWAVAPQALVHWNGAVWTYFAYPGQNGALAHDFDGVSANAWNDVWAVGDLGILHYNGSTWSTSFTATSSQHMRAVSRNWAVGDSGTVLQWTGTTWASFIKQTQGNASLYTVSATPSGDEVFFGGDGSSVWHRGTLLPKKDIAVTNLNGLAAADPNRLLVYGQSMVGVSDLNAVQTYAPTTVNMNAAFGASATDYWVVGDNGTVLRSSNGSAWSPLASGTTSRLLAVGGAIPGNVWVGGEGGTILQFDGTKLRTVGVAAPGTVRSFWFAAANDGWAVGDSGTLLHWDGMMWSVVPGDPSTGSSRYWLTAVWGAASNDVWAIGAAGFAMHWDGSGWQTYFTDTGRNLVDIAGTKSNDVYAIASNEIVHWDGTRWTSMGVSTGSLFTKLSVDATRGMWIADHLGKLHKMF